MFFPGEVEMIDKCGLIKICHKYMLISLTTQAQILTANLCHLLAIMIQKHLLLHIHSAFSSTIYSQLWLELTQAKD